MFRLCTVGLQRLLLLWPTIEAPLRSVCPVNRTANRSDIKGSKLVEIFLKVHRHCQGSAGGAGNLHPQG